MPNDNDFAFQRPLTEATPSELAERNAMGSSSPPATQIDEGKANALALNFQRMQNDMSQRGRKQTGMLPSQ